MLIRSLRLKNFRNYADIRFEFHPELNIITGNNGVGKTNILESILLTSNTRSFRALRDQDLIRYGEEYARVETESDAGNFKVVLNKSGKTLFYDSKLIKKTSDYIGKLNAVLFKPNDLELFSQSPRERRRILDIEIGKVSRQYLEAMLRYNSLLKDKNKLLKEVEIDQTLLSLIEETMVPQIKTIIEARTDFFAHINSSLSEIYQSISGTDTEIKAVYKRCCDPDRISETIAKNREKDLYYRYATFGPHHEDYTFRMGDHDLESIASQGQKRMVLIAFKFAIIRYIKDTSGVLPVVLLDDILSELDKENVKRLLNNLPAGSQTIITNTDIDELDIPGRFKHIHIKEE